MTETGLPADSWRARIIIEYDGVRFAGSQFQPGQRTVQGVVEEALARLTGEWRRIALAGRTDTGVHARGQVASAVAPTRFTSATLRRALNALLPEDVAVVMVDEMGAGFHARFSAASRRYVYSIWNGPVRSPLRRTTTWHVRAPLDVAAMQEAALALVGEHDFASFAGAGLGVPDANGQAQATHRRLTYLSVEIVETSVYGRLIQVTVAATAFLPHMVRNIVGALAAVGRDKWSVATLREVLAATDRRRSAPTAPAHGLTLESVAYEDANDYHGIGAERPPNHKHDQHERVSDQRSLRATGGMASAEE